MTDLVPALLIALLAIVLITMSLKIAREDERFAVFTLGRFAGFSGPGLVVAAPFVTQLCVLKVGDLGVMTGAEFAKFGDTDIPVKNTHSLRTGQAVCIDGFDGTEPRIVSSSARPMNQCPNCGHQF